MLTFLTKKKISESKIANVFINGLFSCIDEGFEDVVELIKADQEFITVPKISVENDTEFIWIVFAGNLHYIPYQFNDYQDVRITASIIKKLSDVLEMKEEEVKLTIAKYQSYLKTINIPSKNMHYAMSKAVFHKYDLNCYQDEYFKKMKTPNPIFLKHLDEIMANFLFDWEPLKNKFKIVQ